MVYSEFIKKTFKYLNSVRVLKNYVTFDMLFSTNWDILKNAPEGLEIFQNQDKDNKVITSFVCENKQNLIDLVEKTVDAIITTNLEREEKERLFKLKVNELKGIFESGDLETLRTLKFDTNELNIFNNNDTKSKTATISEGNGIVEKRESKA